MSRNDMNYLLGSNMNQRHPFKTMLSKKLLLHRVGLVLDTD